MATGEGVTIRLAQRNDLEAVGALGVMLMETHYAFDPQRFLAAREGAAQGYASFLGAMMKNDVDASPVGEIV